MSQTFPSHHQDNNNTNCCTVASTATDTVHHAAAVLNSNNTATDCSEQASRLAMGNGSSSSGQGNADGDDAPHKGLIRNDKGIGQHRQVVASSSPTTTTRPPPPPLPRASPFPICVAIPPLAANCVCVGGGARRGGIPHHARVGSARLL